MRPRALLVPALLVAASGLAYTQPAPRPAQVPEPARLIPPPGVPFTPPRPAPADAPPAEKSLDQLLDRLEALRAQKAELERQEQEVVKEIRRKVERQSDRLQRLGVNDPLLSPPSPSVSFAPAVIPTVPSVPAVPPVVPPLPTVPGQ
ncbi:hypothetical protein J0H58_23555 [bacterium]|nr:hypothetical protein [bacterium]